VTGTAPQRRGTILVVDDDPILRELLATVLTQAGFGVVRAEDGRRALQLINEHRYAAVLLDDQLPGMAGVEVVEAVRSSPETSTVPIILVTAKGSLDDRIRGLRAGANDYVVKPFQASELLARLEAQLREQAAWLRVLDTHLRERARIATALCRVNPRHTPERTAAVVCDELRLLRDLSGVALISFPGPGWATTLACRDLWLWGMEAGRPLPNAVARYLWTRATEGPWIEAPGDTGIPPEHRGLVAQPMIACAPLLRDSQVLGLLALTTQSFVTSANASERSRALSAAIDFAGIAAGLLGPALNERLDNGSRTALDTVLAERAFAPVYQPIVDLRDGRLIGYEALTRFADGTPPEVRFAEAATAERSVELEQATLSAAVQHSAALPEDCWLSLNVSPSLVLDSDVLPPLLAGSGRRVVLEITEHDPVHDYQALRRAIARLGDGVELSVDDAGSGFASLRHVLALGPSFMKLDASWVSGIDADPARQALIAGLSHFAAETGCHLIAEGIERQTELDMLQRLEVELGQGYFLGEPAPVPA
jgi:EAL domain-containing protein (putative c-di-GMP-specific phosphodiesterase class I)/DNA-binding response OmpR family regulator